jgi:hypothetical protein
MTTHEINVGDTVRINRPEFRKHPNLLFTVTGIGRDFDGWEWAWVKGKNGSVGKEARAVLIPVCEGEQGVLPL